MILLRSSFILLIYIIPLCECFSLSEKVIYGKRLFGLMMKSVKTTGPQMCFLDCLKTVIGCESINFNSVHLICEFNRGGNIIVDFANDTDYYFIELSDINPTTKVTGTFSRCNADSCMEWEECILLKSGRNICMDVKPQDCADLRKNGVTGTGVYTIFPSVSVELVTYCDMDTDKGGWTVFQRRLDGSVDFNRGWMDYKHGFGRADVENWMGNDNLHILLSNGDSELRYEMTDFNDSTRFLQYDNFYIGNEEALYMFSLSGLVDADVADCLTSFNGMKFSTFDNDNDFSSKSNCAGKFNGGWWYKSCHCTNPNGLYLGGHMDDSLFAQGMTYKPWHGHYYSLKETKLMVRRKFQ